MILDVFKNRFKKFFLTNKTSKLFLLNNSNWTREVGNKNEGICFLTISLEPEKFWFVFNETDSFWIPSWLKSILPWLKCEEISFVDSFFISWETAKVSLLCNNK